MEKSSFTSTFIRSGYELADISRSLLTEGSLTEGQKGVLEGIVERELRLTERLYSNFGRVAKIRALSERISSNKASLPEAAQKIAEISQTLSQDEERAFAELLLSYQDALDHPLFSREVTRSLERRIALDRNALQKLVDRQNALAFPSPSLAGRIAYDVEGIKIYYNERGLLVLGEPSKKEIDAIVPCKKRLSCKEIEEIKRIYHKIADGAYYNNLGPMLEFMRFLRKCRKTNPSLTTKEAFDAFQVRLTTIFEKYRGGDCVVLTAVVQASLREAGFEAAALGEFTGPIWAKAPPLLGEKLIDWKEYDEATEDVHHTTVVTRFQTSEKEDRGIYFDFFATISDLQEGSWEEISELAASGRRDTKANITNLGHIVKTQLRGKTKMIMKGADNALLGIDLLKGNLYLNQAASKQLRDLPLNPNGRFSLSLEDLQTPDSYGSYLVNGQRVSMTHREVLEALVQQGREIFTFPPDFTKNLLFFAQEVDGLFQDCLLSPSMTAKTAIVEASQSVEIIGMAKAQLKEFRAASSIESGMIIKYMQQFESIRNYMEELFCALQGSILTNEIARVQRNAQLIQPLNSLLKRQVLRIQKRLPTRNIEPKSKASAVSPVPLVQVTYPPLSQERVGELIEQFKEETRSLNYNTMAPLLEFAGWVRSQGGEHSWKELLETFELSVDALVHDYKGGPAALSAMVAQKMLADKGLKGSIIGMDYSARKFYYPFEVYSSGSRIWQEAEELLHGYSDLVCCLHYTGEDRYRRVLTLAHPYAIKESAKIHWEGWDVWDSKLQALRSYRTSYLEKPLDYLKADMQISLVSQITSKEIDEKCTLNLARGTLTVAPGNLPHLPKKPEHAEALFSIEDLLKEPEELMKVLLDGEVVKLTQREILDIYLTTIQREFSLPASFQENLIFLIQNRERFCEEVSPKPAPILGSLSNLSDKIHYARLRASCVVDRESEKKIHDRLHHLKNQGDAYFDEASSVLEEGEADFGDMETEIQNRLIGTLKIYNQVISKHLP